MGSSRTGRKIATASPDEDQAAADEPGLVTWHAGIRVGPYTPQIDAQLGARAARGPYSQMFGGASVLPMLDVDRVLWTGFGGQFAVGGTIGYLQKTAHAFVDGSLPSDPMRPRSAGAENSFHLIPFALTATYRLTYLDDNYGIPVVPYLRGGLAYYVWWAKAPDGNFSKVCSDVLADGARLREQQGARRLVRRPGLARHRDPRRADRRAGRPVDAPERDSTTCRVLLRALAREGRRLRLVDQARGRRQHLVRRRRLRILIASQLTAAAAGVPGVAAQLSGPASQISSGRRRIGKSRRWIPCYGGQA